MPHSTVRQFDDPLSYKATIRNTDLDVFPTAKGKFCGEFVHVNFDRLWLQGVSESLPRVYVGNVSPSRATIGFLTNLDQPSIQHCGTDISPGEIIFNNSAMMHRRTTSASHWGAMTLAPDDLAKLSEAIVGREISVQTASQILRPKRHLSDRLIHLHQTAVELAKNEPDALTHHGIARALEEELTVTMVKCLAEPVLTLSRSQLNHSLIMRRFEEFLSENSSRPLYLGDICKATGASERILRASCHESLGMGPVRYLWLRRMHLARRSLLAGSIETTSVTAIAMDNGFWELGRFASEYRSLFGESPSNTLRRFR
jgi:AraC-like DNA-binding protein